MIVSMSGRRKTICIPLLFILPVGQNGDILKQVAQTFCREFIKRHCLFNDHRGKKRTPRTVNMTGRKTKYKELAEFPQILRLLRDVSAPVKALHKQRFGKVTKPEWHLQTLYNFAVSQISCQGSLNWLYQALRIRVEEKGHGISVCISGTPHTVLGGSIHAFSPSLKAITAIHYKCTCHEIS